MKVVPKLSNEQLNILDRLMRAENEVYKARKRARPPVSTTATPPPTNATKSVAKMPFALSERVEVIRDVAETSYRAGQRGIIQVLHGLPPKVAEVELDNSNYSDVVALKDLRIIG